MKRLLLLGVGSALVFTMGGVGPAQADGGQHISTASGVSTVGVVIASAGAGRCASCHRAHTAKAEYLLKDAQPALCYTCHGGGSGATTDVQFGVSGGTAALRGGGFDTAKIGSGLATKDMAATAASYGIPSINQVIPALGTAAATTSKHNINGGAGDAGTAWGNGPIGSGVGKSITLECGSCHDPHGNGNYRILRPMPVDSQWVVTPAVIANPTAVPPVVGVAAVMSPKTDIRIPDVPAEATTAGSHVYTTANYWLTGDAKSPAGGSTALTNGTSPAGVTDGYIQNVAAWCTTCHTRYLAGTGSYKTASGDPTFMYKHRSDANYKQGAANCITCHVSHGSNAAMIGVSASVPLPGVGAPAGDSRLLRVDNRGTCVMCHNV